MSSYMSFAYCMDNSNLLLFSYMFQFSGMVSTCAWTMRNKLLWSKHYFMDWWNRKTEEEQFFPHLFDIYKWKVLKNESDI
jgi:hypothetical protein